MPVALVGCYAWEQVDSSRLGSGSRCRLRSALRSVRGPESLSPTWGLTQAIHMSMSVCGNLHWQSPCWQLRHLLQLRQLTLSAVYTGS
jgi:hypothetical protein